MPPIRSPVRAIVFDFVNTLVPLREAEFLRILQSGTVQTIHTQEATLEDIFIRVTGRSLA